MAESLNNFHIEKIQFINTMSYIYYKAAVIQDTEACKHQLGMHEIKIKYMRDIKNGIKEPLCTFSQVWIFQPLGCMLQTNCAINIDLSVSNLTKAIQLDPLAFCTPGG